MGLIGQFLGMLFGGGRNVVKETAEVFRVNAEAQDQRGADIQTASLAQLAAEFQHQRQGWFDRLIDGMNRLPRPAMAIGTLALLVSAMYDPIWFAERMTGIALVPEPLWWLLGAIVSFYFGARHQSKSQDFNKQIAQTMAMAPMVMNNLRGLGDLREDTDLTPGVADPGTDAELALQISDDAAEENPALAEIRAGGRER